MSRIISNIDTYFNICIESAADVCRNLNIWTCERLSI